MNIQNNPFSTPPSTPPSKSSLDDKDDAISKMAQSKIDGAIGVESKGAEPKFRQVDNRPIRRLVNPADIKVPVFCDLNSPQAKADLQAFRLNNP